MSGKAPIAGILNSYSPATGQSVSNLIIRTDGTIELHGDESLARCNLGRLIAAAIPSPSQRSTPTDQPPR